jgi:hypothetical protein
MVVTNSARWCLRRNTFDSSRWADSRSHAWGISRLPGVHSETHNAFGMVGKRSLHG